MSPMPDSLNFAIEYKGFRYSGPLYFRSREDQILSDNPLNKPIIIGYEEKPSWGFLARAATILFYRQWVLGWAEIRGLRGSFDHGYNFRKLQLTQITH